MDHSTKRVKIGMHIIFDEAGYTIPPANRTVIQQCLQYQHMTTTIEDDDNTPYQLVWNTESTQYPIVTPQSLHSQQSLHPLEHPQESHTLSSPQVNPTHTLQIPIESSPSTTMGTTVDDTHYLRVCKLTENATIPTRATNASAGYDLYSAVDIAIPSNEMVKIPTDISICPPPSTYCQILSCSGLLTKHGLEVKAGTIDRDYNGNVTMVLQNTSQQSYNIKKGDRVAQIIVYKIANPNIIEAEQPHCTVRGSNCFGSTGISNKDTVRRVKYDDKWAPKEPFNIWLSTDPFY
jgi:dUTP pyrophosphatase